MPKGKERWGSCSFCAKYKLVTREHVFPNCIYPPSSANSRIQRITIPACKSCNGGSSDDDAHFRNVMALAGNASDAVDQLWTGAIRRGLDQVDGHRRASDVFAIMRPASDVGHDRYRIFPADDGRVLRSVRKIVRGLSRYHNLPPLVAEDDQVFADVQRENIPEGALESFTRGVTDPEICKYGFLLLDGIEGMHSAWILQFFGRTNFVATICIDAEARIRTFGPNTSSQVSAMETTKDKRRPASPQIE